MSKKKNNLKYFLLFLVVLFFINQSCYGWKKKKLPTELFLSVDNPLIYDVSNQKIQEQRIFKKGERIYFLIKNPNNFKSDFIKYQIVKQDDNAHIGGYSRIKNQTVKLKDKNSFCDYFVLWQNGKYYLQVFDITDTNHWLNIEGFRIVDE